MICEGECYELETCNGEVKHVHVYDDTRDWGYFWYCDTAIEVDKNNGFTVDLV